MKASRSISLQSAIAVVLTLCLSTLCLGCATQRGTATIPAGPQLIQTGPQLKAPGTPVSHSVPQHGRVP